MKFTDFMEQYGEHDGQVNVSTTWEGISTGFHVRGKSNHYWHYPTDETKNIFRIVDFDGDEVFSIHADEVDSINHVLYPRESKVTLKPDASGTKHTIKVW
jgi:hypothetical protein